jgi:hypothetical protein
MAFIDQIDYRKYISDARLLQIIDNEPAILDEAEITAIQNVRDALHSRYDVDLIFAQTGASRKTQVVQWCVWLVLYYVHNRIPDKVVPERIQRNYEIALDILKDIEDAKKSVELPQLQNTDGSEVTKVRFGGNKPRTHIGY